MSSVIGKYLETIREFTSEPGIYAYRGQANSKWKLHSSATRRLLKEARNDGEVRKQLENPNFTTKYIDYHHELIKRAHTSGFGIEGGRQVTDLQLLAKLQHFRAATGLLDFTWSPFVALWFACERIDDKDGAIFIVNTNDPFCVREILDRPDLEDKLNLGLRYIFSPQPDQPDLLYLKPTLGGDVKSRILSQHSLFIMGRPLIPEGSKIIEIPIEKDDKEPLRKDLEHLDFNESSLFRGDIYGFAQVESVTSPLPQEHDVSHYFMQGNQSYQQGRYKDAVADYDKTIALAKPDEALLAWVYVNRGNAEEFLGRHEDAISDYDKAIELKPDFAEAYFNRGIANWHLKHEDKARQDLEEALSLAIATGDEDLVAKIRKAIEAGKSANKNALPPEDLDAKIRKAIGALGKG